MSLKDQDTPRSRSRLAIALDGPLGPYLLVALVSVGYFVVLVLLAIILWGGPGFLSWPSTKQPRGYHVSSILRYAATDTWMSTFEKTISNTPSLIAYAEINIWTNGCWSGLSDLCPNIWLNTNYNDWTNGGENTATRLVAECADDRGRYFVAYPWIRLRNKIKVHLLDGPPAHGFYRICLKTNRVEVSAR
jgi:hypothetical protein